MAVIADTSPLNYLALIGAIDLLPALYGSVVIPQAVFAELTHPGAPEPVREWAKSTKGWVSVAAAPEDYDLSDLDAGEREAIALAASLLPGSLVIMDDARGRAEAERRATKLLAEGRFR